MRLSSHRYGASRHEITSREVHSTAAGARRGVRGNPPAPVEALPDRWFGGRCNRRPLVGRLDHALQKLTRCPTGLLTTDPSARREATAGPARVSVGAPRTHADSS